MYAWGMENRLGNFIRRRREQLGLTLAEVGERAGMSPQHVHNYESGKNHLPPPEVVPRLAAALEVDEVTLLREVGYLQGSAPTEAIIEHAARMNPDDLARALRDIRRELESLERQVAPRLPNGNSGDAPQSA